MNTSNSSKSDNWGVFTNGIFKENPVLVMLLGTCPTLAVTTTLMNGIGMGLATLFALVCSNIVISLLKNVIPNQVRLPCYIVIISGFVTLVAQLLQAFMPALYDSLGLFLSLIAVNCIIFARAEAFASKNGVLKSALDGVGMGLGFTLALSVMASIREILGSGTILSGLEIAGKDYTISIPILSESPVILFILPAGGFFTYAVIIAVMGKITKKPIRDIGCDHCPSRAICDKRKTEITEVLENSEINEVGEVNEIGEINEISKITKTGEINKED